MAATGDLKGNGECRKC